MKKKTKKTVKKEIKTNKTIKKTKSKKAQGKFRVWVTESERGWGMSYETVYFKTKKAAQKYVDEINSANTDPTAPDWYIQAELMDGE